MDLDYMLSLLEEKDTSKAFEALKELEKISDDSNILYSYIDKFAAMVHNEKYVIRVRGFRLLCRQAKWDIVSKLDGILEPALSILDDEKPTAVRQALFALQNLVLYKKDLRSVVREKVLAIDYLRYKDTMHSLIANDIQELLNIIDEV